MNGPRGSGSTDAVHAGEARRNAFDAVSMPIVQTATYTFADTAELRAYTSGTHENADRGEYGRYGNPTVRAVERRVAALDRTADAVLLSSGMAAVTTTLLALVRAGQHVVLFRDCYRRTLEFVTRTLPRLGVAHTLLDPGDLDVLTGAIRPETRLVMSELPTNPYLSCVDLERLVAICKAHRTVKTMIDATLATPINCRPAEFGVDIVVHSATKYLAGHNDVLAGVVCGPDGIVSLVRDMRGLMGSVCDPHAAFLVGRGLKTLSIRLERQNVTALAVARRLEAHPGISRVYYPGLESHPTHAIARAQMRGFGGVVSFVVGGGIDAAARFVDRLRLARIGPSFGGVETLVEQPAVMSYYELTSEERKAVGIEDGLVRLAVGVEDAEDVIADLEQAFRLRTARCQAAGFFARMPRKGHA